MARQGWLLGKVALNLCLVASLCSCVIDSGFVRGPPGTIPELVTFQQEFKKGALLTVVS